MSMKFVVARQELCQLINRAINVVSLKPTIPILSNFLLEAVDGQLILTATDLTVGLRCFTEAKIVEEGVTTIPAKRFSQLVRELTAQHIEVTAKENDIIEICADSSTFKLLGMNRGEFPVLPDLEGALQFKVKQSDLKMMFYRTSFAVSKEDNRYVLTGVYMQIKDGKASFTGTDGKRLARASFTIDVEGAVSGNYIVPLKAVEEILKNLDENSDDMATIYLMSDKIALRANSVVLISKLLVGEYPDVSRVIPENSETVVSLHREELMTLLRQISLFIPDLTNSICFTFTEGELRLTANTSDIGEGKVSMPVNYHGAPLKVAFNPSFFLDILKNSKEEAVAIGLTDSFSPGVITDTEMGTSSPANASPLFVLMPMRLNEE
jgi:DNA polymerase-3 subunit beta